MRRRHAALLLPLLFTLAATAAAAVTPADGPTLSLREVYEAAPAQDGYDRVLTLETGRLYTGGLLIGPVWDDDRQRFVGGPGADVRIEGNGAILDLRGQQLVISFCDRRLDVVDCIITGGGSGSGATSRRRSTARPGGRCGTARSGGRRTTPSGCRGRATGSSWSGTSWSIPWTRAATT